MFSSQAGPEYFWGQDTEQIIFSRRHGCFKIDFVVRED